MSSGREPEAHARQILAELKIPDHRQHGNVRVGGKRRRQGKVQGAKQRQSDYSCHGSIGMRPMRHSPNADAPKVRDALASQLRAGATRISALNVETTGARTVTDAPRGASRASGALPGSVASRQRYRSSGLSPVRFATRASMRGPIVSLS